MTTVAEWFADRDASLSEEDATFIQGRRGKDLALEFDRVNASGLTPFQELARERQIELDDTWNWYFTARHELVKMLESGLPMGLRDAELRVDDLISAARTQVRLSAREHEWREGLQP